MQEQTSCITTAREEMPYGRGPFLVGLAAVDALYDLCIVPKWTDQRRGCWIPGDTMALQGWLNIEESTPGALAEPGIGQEQVERLSNLLTRYHLALPFDEAERQWLYETYSPREGISDVRSKEATIVCGGLRHVIHGRELLRRWWSWRRETDQFIGQGTLGLARETLRELIETLSPSLSLPETYVALQADENQSEI